MENPSISQENVISKDINLLIDQIDSIVDSMYNPAGPFEDPVDDGRFERIAELLQTIFEKSNLTVEQYNYFKENYLDEKIGENELNNFTKELKEFLKSNGVDI